MSLRSEWISSLASSRTEPFFQRSTRSDPSASRTAWNDGWRIPEGGGGGAGAGGAAAGAAEAAAGGAVAELCAPPGPACAAQMIDGERRTAVQKAAFGMRM